MTLPSCPPHHFCVESPDGRNAREGKQYVDVVTVVQQSESGQRGGVEQEFPSRTRGGVANLHPGEQRHLSAPSHNGRRQPTRDESRQTAVAPFCPLPSMLVPSLPAAPARERT